MSEGFMTKEQWDALPYEEKNRLCHGNIEFYQYLYIGFDVSSSSDDDDEDLKLDTSYRINN